MALAVNRLKIRINPNFKKVIPRFFDTGDKRSMVLINKLISMPDGVVLNLLNQVMEDFSSRYKDLQEIFLKHFYLIKHLLTEDQLLTLTEERKKLIGSYFTMEYAIEAAALFNPSIVEDFDQSGAGPGEKNVILSFRATGESHISSLVFKRGKLDANAVIQLEEDGSFLTTGVVMQKRKDNKLVFGQLLSQVSLREDIKATILDELHEPFSYQEIEAVLKNAFWSIESATERKRIQYDILSMVNTAYELEFPADSLLSERVIFPVTFTEKNGIEDARFTKFTDEEGVSTFIATYTAYDGSYILPHLIKTKDFLHFKMSPLHGKAAINKNLALFPRKVNGQYVMLARIDGENNFIMFSDDLYTWDNALLLQMPKYDWELVQIGNGGSPIETAKGWLVITHGVGPMRKYCLGASLFDIDNPQIELGRLKKPLLIPNEDERHGYVPNVVYTCGAIIHGDKLLIPYAVSDFASSFVTLSLVDLLDEILKAD